MTPSVNQRFVAKHAMRSRHTTRVGRRAALLIFSALRETVGIRLAISTPTNISTPIAMPGWSMADLRNCMDLTPSSESARRSGVRTIQHPPGAGTPRKKCFQYGRVGCSSNRARRNASHME